MQKRRILTAAAALTGALLMSVAQGSAATLDDVISRLDNLQRENAAMRKEITALRHERGSGRESSASRLSARTSGQSVAASPTTAMASADPPSHAAIYSGQYDWAGFYAGLNAGYASGKATTEFNGLPFAFESDTQRYDGFFAGGQLGYNYQWGPLVVGVEADLQYASLGGRSNVFPAAGFIAGNSLDVFGTVRGRVGYAFDRFMPYITGGLAVGQNTMHYVSVFTSVVTDRNTQSGWTAGGGFEYGIYDGWSLKAEYLHVDLGEVEYVPFTSFGLFSTTAALRFDLVRAGLNYHF